MTPHPLAGTPTAGILCDVYTLWDNADQLIQESPKMYAINRGPIETVSEVFALAADPLETPGDKTVMCLCKFLDGSAVAVRYRSVDVVDRKVHVMIESAKTNQLRSAVMLVLNWAEQLFLEEGQFDTFKEYCDLLMQRAGLTNYWQRK